MLTKFGKIYPPEGSPIAGHSPVCRHPLGENKESVEQRVFKGLPIAYSVEIRFYKAYELAPTVWEKYAPPKGSPIAGHSPVFGHPLGENKGSVEIRVFNGLPIAYLVE